MKWIEAKDHWMPRLELTRRNLTILLEKLDDPLSGKRLICPGNCVEVVAVEDGGMKWVAGNGRKYGRPTLELSRDILQSLLAKLDDPNSTRRLICPGNAVEVKAVEDDEHYSDREPGAMYMPSKGEYL